MPAVCANHDAHGSRLTLCLQSSFSELQYLEYFKLGFLEMQNVTIQSVFLNPVTYNAQALVSMLAYRIMGYL